MNRISTRLAISFLIVALLPTLPLSLVVHDLLERRFGPTIATPLATAMDAGLAESRAHLVELQKRLHDQAKVLNLGDDAPPLVVLDADGTVQNETALQAYLKRRPDLATQVEGLMSSTSNEVSVFRISDTIVVRRDQPPLTIVIQPLPDGMVQRADDLKNGVSLLRVVRADDRRVLISFLGPFLVIYAVLIVVALTIGFLWSRQIVGPLSRLVSATRRVSRGNLDFRMKRQGPGEVGELVHSFNNMVGRLDEQRRDLARLERAAAWRGMARTMAHEVKNPLTPILMAVHQVRDSYHGEDSDHQQLLQEVAEIVGEEVAALRNLVQEFGDFARLPKPVLKHHHLGELLRDLEKLYGAEVLTLVAVENAGEGWFDHDPLRRSLINLIDNGLTACQEAGVNAVVKIAVERAATQDEPGVTLTITDGGIGISAENVSRIFEPDFTTKSTGMGLGLAIVDNIIIGHGGRITVQSEPNHGTTFTISLPLTALEAAGGDSQDGNS